MTRKKTGTFARHWFPILTALANSDLYGSGIAREVESLTAGRTRLWPVTLYGSLQELVDADLIEELAPDKRPAGESGKKRYYGITKRGRRALAEEARSLSALAATALQRAGGP
jgi:DNA-binding PadR family transcriptional regulator